jgi:hypothetical protein
MRQGWPTSLFQASQQSDDRFARTVVDVRVSYRLPRNVTGKVSLSNVSRSSLAVKRALQGIAALLPEAQRSRRRACPAMPGHRS